MVIDSAVPPAGYAGPIYPPRLADALCSLLPDHPLLSELGAATLGKLLSEVFFASLEDEEGKHEVIRVALTTSSADSREPWPGQLRFRNPTECSSRHLVRLARATRSERMFVSILASAAGLHISGLVRERFGEDERTFVKVRALKPGCLEVWVSGERILEYVRGYIQRPPEDVLLSTGPVREKLLAFHNERTAPPGYVEAVASILRELADHPHGGILVLSAESTPSTPPQASFAIEADAHLWDLLYAMQRASLSPSTPSLQRETIRSEIQRTISEVGRMTALDGATILDRHLGVRGFGVVLPVRNDVVVLEAVDAAGKVRRPFPLDQHGARHRAAASYADSHPGSIVFFASVSGDIGCMLKDEPSTAVLLWRFRSGALSSPSP
jgi:hypothetical protein